MYKIKKDLWRKICHQKLVPNYRISTKTKSPYLLLSPNRELLLLDRFLPI